MKYVLQGDFITCIYCLMGDEYELELILRTSKPLYDQ